MLILEEGWRKVHRAGKEPHSKARTTVRLWERHVGESGASIRSSDDKRIRMREPRAGTILGIGWELGMLMSLPTWNNPFRIPLLNPWRHGSLIQ